MDERDKLWESWDRWKGKGRLGWGTSVASVLSAEVVGSNWLADLLGKSWEGEVEAVGGSEVLELTGDSSSRGNKVAWLREQPKGVVVEGVVWRWLRTRVWGESSGAVVDKGTGGQVVGNVGLPPVKTGGAVGAQSWNKAWDLGGSVRSDIVWNAQVDHEDHVLVKVKTWGEDGWVEGVRNGLRKLLGWDEDGTVERDTKVHRSGWRVTSRALSGGGGGEGGNRGQDSLDGRHCEVNEC